MSFLIWYMSVSVCVLPLVFHHFISRVAYLHKSSPQTNKASVFNVHTPNTQTQRDKHEHNMSFVKGGFGLVSICIPKNGRSLTCRGFQAAICKRLEMQFRKQNRLLFSIGKSKSFVCHLVRVNCGPCWATGTENDVTNREMRILIHYTNRIRWLRLFLCIPIGLTHQLFKSFANRQQDQRAFRGFSMHPQCAQFSSAVSYIICRILTDFRYFELLKWCPEISLMKPIPSPSATSKRTNSILKFLFNGLQWQVMLPHLLMPMWGL